MKIIQTESPMKNSRKDQIEGLYPLSGLQQGMLFHGLYDEKAGAYIEQFACNLVEVNLEIFIKSWEYILDVHSILRSAFFYDKFNIPVQCVYKDVKLPVEILDYQGLDTNLQQENLQLFEKLDSEKGFDFKAAPLMRLTLICISENGYRMIWTYHHIILDGWSMPILMEEFLNTYETLSKGTKLELKEVDEYEDYIRYIERRDKKQEQLFWKNYLRNIDSGTLLPFVKKTIERTKGIGTYSTLDLNINAERTTQIKDYLQKYHLTANTLMQGVWSHLLHSYTGEKDVVFGVIVSGRPDDLENVERRVGMYINTLPLHTSINKDEKVEEWLTTLQKEQVELREYQHTPLSSTKEWSGVRGDLFDSLLVFENYPVSKLMSAREWKLKVENVSIKEQTNYPLTIAIGVGENINIHFSYNTELIEEEYIQGIRNHFEHVLIQIVEKPQISLRDIKLLSTIEEQQILEEFNNTAVSYPKDKSIIDLLEDQVKKTPNNVALLFKEEKLTYGELNKRSNQLARHLNRKGVTKETVVPIFIERSIEMIVGILAILKSGGVYVPMDPEYPEERIKYMLQDTGASVIVSSVLSKKKLPDLEDIIEIIEIDTDWEEINKEKSEDLGIKVSPTDLAYIIYTSGSTGKPKGVMIEHLNVVRLFETEKPLFDFNENDVWTMFHSFCFDFSVWEMYGALFYGGSLVVVPSNATKDTALFSNLLIKEKVTILNQTPSSFYVLQDILTEEVKNIHVRYVIFGGEALNPAKLQPWKKMYSKCRLINMYGITETTVHVTYQEIGWKQIENGNSIIGKTIPTLNAYILDDNQNLLPVGIAGELCIGGAGLARGYFKREDLTAKKFIKNPFSDNEEERIYRSGDLGRWTPNGTIEYIGRMDDQVKIRGFRIELGEIETALIETGLVKQAVIVAIEEREGIKRLAGYIVVKGELNKEELMTKLRLKLPEYMIPQVWVNLESLPLTSNGKIDKKALPSAQSLGLLGKDYVAPRSEIEEKLTIIWQELLGIERIGIHDNFFELGGHSLLAMRLLSSIRKQLGLEILMKNLFLYPTIVELSGQLNNHGAESLLPSIKAEQRPVRIPLSFSQERLWFIDQKEGSQQYHIPAVLTLEGKLNVEALTFSLQTIVNRHEVLRTVFKEIDGQIYQDIKAKDQFELKIITELENKENPESLSKYIRQLVNQPFNLSEDYMLRASLISLEENKNMLVITMHHIAADAWSISILVKEVVDLYESFIEKRQQKLILPPIQYADYSIWQRNYLQGALLQNKIEYWKKKLNGVETLQLPADFERMGGRSIKGEALSFSLNKDLTDQLNVLSNKEGTTLFMTLLSAYKVLLYRYSGQSDISVGTSIANRPQQEVENLVGFFVNTLALRDEIKGEQTFKELLQLVRTTTMEAYEHQEVAFEKVVEVVVKDRDQSRSPLFQVMLVFNNTPDVPALRFGDVELKREKFVTNISKFEISFFVTETPQGLQATVEYSSDLYKEATIGRMVQHYTELLKSVVNNPGQQVGLLPMLTQPERINLEENSYQRIEYPQQSSVVELFEKEASKAPEAIAVVFGEKRYSYGELNEKSNQLAHYLRSRGVGEDTLVPLFIERSAQMIVGILGVLKAGGAYVPIDTEFPAERISYMLEDTGAKVIVSSEISKEKLGAIGEGIEIIEIDSSKINSQAKTNPEQRATAKNLAYVIYTSGSTGNPKGVMIEHRSLVDYVYGLKEATGIENCKSHALVSTIATDLGNTVLYSSLLTGGALHVFTKEAVSDIYGLHKYFKEQEIECLKIVPSHWKALSKEEALLLPTKLLVFGGEALHTELTEAIEKTGTSCQVVNHYGPTETTIGKLLHVVEKGRKYNKTIPIGKPFSNTQVYVLSKDMELCPIGVPGQLYIAGDGVARGYLNNEALTRSKFVANPFRAGTVMYSTGDQVKYLGDGNIEFIGRVDNQVKIRGYRIELGEIESILQQSEQVRQGVVIAREDKQGNKKLVAYIVPRETFDREAIYDYLKEKLPEYMAPSVIVELENLPLTANGKVDRKALPDPEATETHGGGYVAPRNTTEEKLAEIWAEILEVDQVDIHDDFFELGGHSLLAIRLISMIRKELGSEVKIGDVFDYPTIALLSDRLKGEEEAPLLPTIEVKTRPEKIPLSFSQERLWFIDQLEGSVQYHLPTVLRLKGKLDTGALEYSLQQIVNRHEVLRTVFREEGGVPYQYIKEKDKSRVEKIEGKQYKEDPEGLRDYIKQLVKRPFDLKGDDMLRVYLIELGEEEHVLITTMHHIASDAWSTSVMVREVAELYNSYIEKRESKLKEMELQYADYSIWQRNYLKGEVLEKKIAYWKEKLNGVTALALPTDYKRPSVQSTRGAFKNFKIGKELSEQIKELSRQEGTTMFITLQAVYKAMLYRYSGQEDISVGTSIARREQQQLEGLIGFFVNTLALRDEVKGEQAFKELLQQVRQTTMGAYEHQEVPFEKVVEVVVKERDKSRSPLFQVMLVFKNTPEVGVLKLGDIELSGDGYEHTTVKFELTFFIQETGEGLRGSVHYCSDLYKEATIGRMVEHFTELLKSVVKDPGQKVGLLPMLTGSEKTELKETSTQSIMYPEGSSVVMEFEGQVEETPSARALVFGEEKYSYKELNAKSNQLAHYLKSRGVGEGTLVPLFIERSAQMIVGLLGILKAGGAYVPIDTEFPQERISYMLEDTGAKIVVSSEAGKEKLGSAGDDIEIIEIDASGSKIDNQPKLNPEPQAGSKSLAYVIYTSGSTGNPKGVMIEHRSLVDYVYGLKEATEIDKCKSHALVSTIATDLGNTVLYSSLLTGGALHVFTKEAVSDIYGLHKYFKEHAIECLKIVPSHWKALSKEEELLLPAKLLVFGGEALQTEMTEQIERAATNCRVVNHYGPTETTIGKLLHEVEKGRKYNKTIPVGKPFSNTEVYVLSKDMELCPIGVPGQLYISGAGVARGYLNNEALTREKFIENPYSGQAKTLMYGTGDQVKYLPGGEIEFIGRVDNQVKIRGYRIELGEIESILQQSEQVRQGVVIAREDKQGNKRLVGYVVGEEDFEREAVYRYLKEKLPEYMVPSVIVELESLPLTENGKVNRKALPDPEATESHGGGYTAPRNPTEEKLAEIWAEILEVEQVGVHDDFFELGGHSLLAVRMIYFIERKLQISIPINIIFEFTTISALSKYLELQVETQPQENKKELLKMIKI